MRCVIGLIMMVVMLGCSSGPPQEAGGAALGGGGGTGSVGLAFAIPGTLTINQVSYVVAGPTAMSNTVDVSHAQSSIEFVVGPLLAGSGYTIQLAATDTAGDSCVGAATPFTIVTGVTSQLAVNLVCTVGDGAITFADAGTGSLEIDASITVIDDPPTVCPTVAGLSVTPAEEVVGASSAVSVVTAPAGATVTYAVEATDPAGLGNGVVTSVADGRAVFTCTSAGQVRLTARTTAPLANDSGNCPPQSMSALVNCEPGPISTVTSPSGTTTFHMGPPPAPTGLAAPTVPATGVVGPGGLTPIDLSSSNPFSIVYVSELGASGEPIGYWEIDLVGSTSDLGLDLSISGGFAAGSFGLSFEVGDGSGGVSAAANSMLFVAGPPPPPLTAGLAFSQCVALADPHLFTFDGLLYDCQPWGEVTLVRSSTPDDMAVQIRTRPWGTRPDVSVTVAVAAQVVTDRVAFYDDGTMTLDATSTSFGGGVTRLPGGGTVYGVANGYRVVWPDGSQLWVDFGGGFMGVRVFLRDGTGREVVGLCGNADGNLANDLTAQDGQTTLTSPAPFAQFYGTYVKSWRVAADDSDSLFDYPAGETTANFTDLSFPHLLATTQGIDTTAGAAACAAAPGGWQNACTLDVALTGDARFAAEYTSASLPTPAAVEAVEPPPCALPVFSPAPGVVAAGTAVSISAPFVPSSAIHFTTDGTTPTDGSPSLTGPIVVTQTETIAAIASLPGACTDSVSVAATYSVGFGFGGPPHIASVVPALVTASSTISISGSNLAATDGDTSAVTVTLDIGADGGAVSLPITSGGAGALVVSTPANLAPGAATLVVTTPQGSASSSVTVVPCLLGSTCGAGFFGAIYSLVPGTPRLPNFGSIDSLDAPCSDPSVISAPDAGTACPLLTFEVGNVDIPDQSFTAGFPGFPALTQWFAIRFRGLLTVTTPGNYQFTTVSDDGSNVYLFDPAALDGGATALTQVVSNDGEHAFAGSTGPVTTLAAKQYGIIVDYFQGPPSGLGVVLEWTPPGGPTALIPASQLQALVVP